MRTSVKLAVLVVLLSVLGWPTKYPSPELAAQTIQASGVEDVVWIFLTDKKIDDLDSALLGLEASYNPRAVQRRADRRSAPGLFDERDLPISETYLQQLAEHTSRIRVRSRWLNAVSATVTPQQKRELLQLPFVRSLQAVRRGKMEPLQESPFGDGTPGLGGNFYGLAFDQLQTINLPALHGEGLTGNGVVIGVLDTGFKRTHSAFAHPSNPLQVIAEYDFVDDDPITAPEAGDDPNQHRHGTIILGRWPRTLLMNTSVRLTMHPLFFAKQKILPTNTRPKKIFMLPGLSSLKRTVATSQRLR